jgi:hypothetical protein
MLSNLYLLPHLLGATMAKLDIWHGSNREDPEYVADVPESYLALWNDAERAWAAGTYDSPDFASVRVRTIEIRRRLNDLRPGPERSRLVKEMYELIG